MTKCNNPHCLFFYVIVEVEDKSFCLSDYDHLKLFKIKPMVSSHMESKWPEKKLHQKSVTLILDVKKV